MEDSEWIVRARGGDPEAFSRLVDRYQQPVFNLCYRMLHNREDADDATQEAFLKAYRGLEGYDPQQPFLTWLLSIAAHHCIDRLRQRRFQWVSLEALWGRESGSEGPEAALERRQRSRQLERALMELRSIDRAVVIMRYWNELSHAEIGQALRLTPSAVKSRLHRARRQLAEHYRFAATASRQGRRTADPHGGGGERETVRL